jgi:hypothetical protein
MAIQSTQLGGGFDDPILTVPPGKSWAVTTMLFCNTERPQNIYAEEGDVFLDLHLCKGGVAANDGNMILNAIPINAGETFSFDTEKIILEAGDVIKAATTSPTNITATVSYIEV